MVLNDFCDTTVFVFKIIICLFGLVINHEHVNYEMNYS